MHKIRKVYSERAEFLLSRRSILGSLAASPMAACFTTGSVEASSADSDVIAWGREFDNLTAKIDHAIVYGLDIDQDVLDQFSRIEAEIIASLATTIEGLRVKARAACWALLGDLGSGDQSTTDKRMALSIVRDLIRLYDPGLERPGALKDLVKDIEDGASLPTAA